MCIPGRVKIYVTVDEDDPYYTRDEGDRFIRDQMEKVGLDEFVVKRVNPSLRGKICHIWRELAREAYDDGMVRRKES